MLILFVVNAFMLPQLLAQHYAPIKDVDVLKKHEHVLAETYPGKYEQLSIKNVYKILYSKTPYGEDFYTIVMYTYNKDSSKDWNRKHYDEFGHDYPVAF